MCSLSRPASSQHIREVVTTTMERCTKQAHTQLPRDCGHESGSYDPSIQYDLLINRRDTSLAASCHHFSSSLLAAVFATSTLNTGYRLPELIACGPTLRWLGPPFSGSQRPTSSFSRCGGPFHLRGEFSTATSSMSQPFLRPLAC